MSLIYSFEYELLVCALRVVSTMYYTMYSIGQRPAAGCS